MTFEQQGFALYMTFEQALTQPCRLVPLEHFLDNIVKLTISLGCLADVIMSLSRLPHDVVYPNGQRV
jgi:hypothetical protein